MISQRILRLIQKLKLQHYTTIARAYNNDYTQFGYNKIPLSQKESIVHNMFTSVAQSYDIMNDLMLFRIYRYWKDQFVSMSNLEHISKVIRTNGREFKVLDVADGMGDIRFRFLEAGRCVERCKSSGMDDVNIAIYNINANILEVS